MLFSLSRNGEGGFPFEVPLLTVKNIPDNTQLSHSFILAILSVTELQTEFDALFLLVFQHDVVFWQRQVLGKVWLHVPPQCAPGIMHGVQCCVTQFVTFLGFRFQYCYSQWSCTSAEKYQEFFLLRKRNRTEAGQGHGQELQRTYTCLSLRVCRKNKTDMLRFDENWVEVKFPNSYFLSSFFFFPNCLYMWPVKLKNTLIHPEKSNIFHDSKPTLYKYLQSQDLNLRDSMAKAVYKSYAQYFIRTVLSFFLSEFLINISSWDDCQHFLLVRHNFAKYIFYVCSYKYIQTQNIHFLQ